MTIIDGKKTAAEIRAQLRGKTAAFEEKYGQKVGLAVVLIGEDPASQVYVRNKIRGCEEAGIRSFAHYLPADVTQAEAEELVRALASDDAVHGILVQLPLPRHLNADKILACIPAEKDVDGFSAENIGRLARNEECTVACTPLGVMELLHRYGVEPRGKRAVVIGRSNIVGRPMALLLLNADATVTICHSRTVNLAEECARADILIAAIGKPNFVTADMVKEGAVVVDVGINRVDGKLVGDVDFAAVSQKASLITPVPGGVGPMTIAMLLQNAVSCAERAMR
ncbi:MAG TPA: bifunctional methylenetetrahydrofolate dehydrogenase/methenyltetrahydrofolate cyclohydrolase FolD [Candidatus Gallimonas intestinigallinarum]|uniref:Bifunctional protein FolD n=1 Tax=Candidatus Gallimonas intestinigallinarum TaxID=2838604 RepID=A0A9D2IVX3_9FIRM|nr:bifunctional methylenetetrahydrofolate dehydrogenase/methenyltetrahydrofolate cyclohydrolase FolD [Candidatus Gallimonas intestinigallinarum]